MRYFWQAVRWFSKRPELVVVLLAGSLLRFYGVYPGYYAHGDEIAYGEAVYMLLNKTLGMEVQFLGYYPPLVAWIMLLIFLIIFIPANIITNLGDFTLLAILGENWVNAMYWGRYITASFSVGVIFLTYIITELIFLKRLIAFLAALFVTINYRLVLNSQIGFLDIYNAFFLLVVLFSTVLLFRKPSAKNYLLAWLFVALLFLVKYQFYGITALLFVHIAIAVKKSSSLIRPLPYLLRKEFLLGGVIAFLAVLIAHYYHFINFERVVEIYKYQTLKYGVGKSMLNIFPISYWYHVGLGPFLSVFALGGVILGLILRNYRFYSVLLLSPLITLLYIYLYYTQGGFYTRNFLSAIPILSIFAALFLSILSAKLRWRVGLIFLFIITVLSLQEQIRNITIANQILSHESNRRVVERWLNANIPPNTTFGTYSSNPAPQNPAVITKILPSIGEAYSYQELLSLGIEYFLLDFHVTNSRLVWWMNQPTDIGLSFWEKPDNLLSQGYFALATRELLWRKTLTSYLPKWQIPGYNYAVIQLKKDKLSTKLNKIAQYGFKENSLEWQPLYFFPSLEPLLRWSDQGLVILAEEKNGVRPRKRYFWPGTVRWESPALPSQGLSGYKILAMIKNEDFVAEDKKDGFIRLDFYSEKPTQLITSRSIISFVSERISGESVWHRLEIEGIAPEDTKFLTVGFQADNPKTGFYLGKVEIFEAKERVKEKEEEHTTINDDDFFTPNDGGFL